ncbi:LamG-like jellyroll fold domain-containing protein [Flammeovirga aprica]|uniref:T9SS type A sorting domain-containing protein n=1 Tax=Flammeovirga aprica JL-4 TaxID=694437 RepID=A0A7X9S0E3_9BACT|nr:LamG-like jellyroll fold domain-containing protein [Flammeovirga aprica]NME72036.1 T9SS type A sorting domain-containing protein [Flammeovirga aprica JL-4]
MNKLLLFLSRAVFAMLLFHTQNSFAQTAIGVLDFNASEQDKVITNFDGIHGNAPRTVEAWIKTDANGISYIADWGGMGTGARFTVMVDNGKLKITISGSGKGGTTVINDNQWHHIAVSYDGTTARGYVDGKLDFSKDLLVNTASTYTFRLGCRINSTSNFYHGNMADVRIWNVARSAEEINANKKKDFTVYTPPASLVALFRLNEGVGTTVTNSITKEEVFLGDNALTEIGNPDWVIDPSYSSAVNLDKIVLPIEVFGEEGVTRSEYVFLSDLQADQAKHLWLQVNNVGYENKISVRVNDGNKIYLNHSTVDMHYQEKARGGMTLGGFNTIRFSIPVDNFKKGDNKIAFTFELSDAISSGFRIIRLNLLDENKEKMLDDSYFIDEDPNLWEPLYSSVNDIQEGEYLWRNANLWNHYLPEGRQGFWYGNTLPDRRPIKAKCNSCHTQDGRDLEMFSYSNESIIERAKFHGLTATEGKKIASYIRTLSDKHDNVERSGRPWNPPYQPGPEVAELEPHNWHAGAGLDAVLEKDKDLIEYMFEDGVVTKEGVDDFFDARKMEDRTLTPTAMQFPDWKHWLPLVHPMDAYTLNDYWFTEDLEKNPNKAYPELRAILQSSDYANQLDSTTISDAITDFGWSYRGFHHQSIEGSSPHWRAKEGDAYHSINPEIPKELAKNSLAKLRAVQYFEIFNEFNLQGRAKEIYNPLDQPSERQWLGRVYHVFEVPPHFTSCEIDGNCAHFVGQPEETGAFESTVWYALELIIAGGNGVSGANASMDWQYQHNFIKKSGATSGIHEPLRYFKSLNAMYQIRTWTGELSPNNKYGFRIRQQSLSWVAGMSPSNGLDGYVPGFYLKLLDRIQPGMSKWILDAFIQNFLREVNEPHNDLSAWNRSTYGNDNKLDKEPETPRNSFTFTSPDYGYSHDYYTIIPLFIEMGADCDLIDELIDWCQRAWPSWNWSALKVNQKPTISLKIDHNYNVAQQVTATLSNEGTTPSIQWFVNHNAINNNENELFLPSDYFSEGDSITLVLQSSNTCLNAENNSVEETIVIPQRELTVTLNGNTIQHQESTPAYLLDSLYITNELVLHPYLWLDAMQIKPNYSPLENEVINEWYDKSGNEFHGTETDINYQPIYKSNGYNGLPAVVFGENSSDRLELLNSEEDDMLEEDWTIIIVGKSENLDTNNDILGNRGGSGSEGFMIRFNKSGKLFLETGGNNKYFGNKFSFGTKYILQISKKGNELELYVNGKIEGTQTIPDDLIFGKGKPVYIGQSSDKNYGQTRYHKGPIAEVMLFDRTVTELETELIHGYLAHKWRLTENLPLSHPYKNRSPLSFIVTSPSGTKEIDFVHSYQKVISSDDFGKFEIHDNINPFEFELVDNSNSRKATVSSLFNEQVLEDIKVYPNPTNAQFKIVLEEGKPQQIDVFDIHGQHQLYLTPTNGSFTLPDHLPNGIYFVIFSANTKRYILKVIKSL